MAIFITEADPAFPLRGGTNPVADLGSASCLNPISVIFMQFSAIIMPNNRLAPPLENSGAATAILYFAKFSGKIVLKKRPLDPPIVTSKRYA